MCLPMRSSNVGTTRSTRPIPLRDLFESLVDASRLYRKVGRTLGCTSRQKLADRLQTFGATTKFLSQRNLCRQSRQQCLYRNAKPYRKRRHLKRSRRRVCASLDVPKSCLAAAASQRAQYTSQHIAIMDANVTIQVIRDLQTFSPTLDFDCLQRKMPKKSLIPALQD